MIKTIAIGVVLSVVCAQVDLPHGHELMEIVDQYFALTDKNSDGIIQIDELQYLVDLEDTDHNGMISFAEYLAYTQIPTEIAEPVFNTYDTDGDGLIPNSFMSEYLDRMDTNGDGEVSKHEYEHYGTSFFECVFGHGGHGHGKDCTQ